MHRPLSKKMKKIFPIIANIVDEFCPKHSKYFVFNVGTASSLTAFYLSILSQIKRFGYEFIRNRLTIKNCFSYH